MSSTVGELTARCIEAGLVDVGEILLVVFGWFLGLLSPSIVNAISSKRETEKIRNGISMELRDFAYRLVQLVSLFALKTGELSRQKVNWLLEHEQRYRGAYPLGTVSDALAQLRQITDEQLQALNDTNRHNATTTGSSVKTQTLPYLESKLGSISSLPEEEQAHLLEIWSQLAIFNQTVEEARFYFRATFDQSITGENREIVKRSLIESYSQLAFRAQFIVDRIDTLDKSRCTKQAPQAR